MADERVCCEPCGLPPVGSGHDGVRSACIDANSICVAGACVTRLPFPPGEPGLNGVMMGVTGRGRSRRRRRRRISVVTSSVARSVSARMPTPMAMAGPRGRPAGEREDDELTGAGGGGAGGGC